MIYYAIKHLPTGNYLPQLRKKRGHSHSEPLPLDKRLASPRRSSDLPAAFHNSQNPKKENNQMRSLFQITTDMRALTSMIQSLADELDQFAALFSGGGPAVATPFVPSPGKPSDQKRIGRPPGSQNKNKDKEKTHHVSPTKGQKATPELKLLVRQLWFNLTQERQNLKSKREISEKTSVPVSMVATIIRQTPKADLENFLSKQEQPSSVERST